MKCIFHCKKIPRFLFKEPFPVLGNGGAGPEDLLHRAVPLFRCLTWGAKKAGKCWHIFGSVPQTSDFLKLLFLQFSKKQNICKAANDMKKWIQCSLSPTSLTVLSTQDVHYIQYLDWASLKIRKATRYVSTYWSLFRKKKKRGDCFHEGLIHFSSSFFLAF